MTSMSVSGVGSVPGFDVLFPSTPSQSSSASGTSSAAPAGGTSSSGTSSAVAGSDVLNAPLNTENVPGFDILNPAQYFPNAQQIVNGNGSSSNSSGSNTGPTTSPSAGVSSYQQTLNNLEIWSNNYLLSSAENGPPSLTSPTGAQSAGAFASLGSLISALKPLAQINAAAGVGTSSATPSSSTSTNSTTSTDPAEAALGALPTLDTYA